MPHHSGVHFTVLSVIIIAATFVPRGALALNPDMIEGSRIDDEEEISASSSDEKVHTPDEAKYDPQQDDLVKASVGIVAQNSAAKTPAAAV